MATDAGPRTDEARQGAFDQEGRAVVIIRRVLMTGFIAVLLLEAWLALEFYRSLL